MERWLRNSTMPSKPRPLGNNAADAVEDIDELLEANRRVLSAVLDHLFDGNINAAGKGVSHALENNTVAARIALLTRTGEFDTAARVLSEFRHGGMQP